MKKSTKILCAFLGAAAAAAVIPYKIKSDDAGGLVQGLLYKVKWTQDPDFLSEPDVHVTFGFNNPFEKEKEAELFADELVVDYCCDDTLVTNESRLYREEDYMNEEADESDFADESCGGDDTCAE